MRIIKKWLEAIKKFFTNAYPEPIVTKPTIKKPSVKKTIKRKKWKKDGFGTMLQKNFIVGMIL